MNYGSPGVTGSVCANEVCEDADLVIGVGTRFQDFTTGSWTVFANPDRKLVSINLHGYDAQKHGAVGVVGVVLRRAGAPALFAVGICFALIWGMPVICMVTVYSHSPVLRFKGVGSAAQTAVPPRSTSAKESFIMFLLLLSGHSEPARCIF